MSPQILHVLQADERTSTHLPPLAAAPALSWKVSKIPNRKGEVMKSQIWNEIKLLVCSKASMLLQAILVVPALAGPLAIPALAAQPAYVVSAGITGNGVFGIVNTRTGAFQPIGPSEPDGYFGLAPGPHGSLLSLTYTANLVS